jgi:hypothetical protein
MAYEHKPNTGSLFNNKTENPSAPQLKGDAMIDGKMYKVSCWFNKAKDGSQYLNCKYEAKTDAPAKAPATANPWDSFNI